MNKKISFKERVINFIKRRKSDLIVIGILIVISIISLVCVRTLFVKKGSSVQVFIDNKPNKSFDLNKDNNYLINTKEGYNLLVIKNGKARVAEADCVEQICVNTKEISKDGESIICLPHKVVIRIVSDNDNFVDAISN